MNVAEDVEVVEVDEQVEDQHVEVDETENQHLNTVQGAASVGESEDQHRDTVQSEMDAEFGKFNRIFLQFFLLKYY